MLKFLDLIGESSSKIYNRIDELFVPPIEYDEIKASLEKNRVVFITGPPEFGKTYTAIRLLWEFFCSGYNPVWWAGRRD